MSRRPDIMPPLTDDDYLHAQVCVIVQHGIVFDPHTLTWVLMHGEINGSKTVCVDGGRHIPHYGYVLSGRSTRDRLKFKDLGVPWDAEHPMP